MIHIVNLNTYYIRACKDDGEYLRNCKDFSDEGKSKQFDGYDENGEKFFPQQNDTVLVEYDGGFLRAVVLKVESEEKIEVALADIGKKVYVKLQNIRRLSEDLFNRKRYNYLYTSKEILNYTNKSFSKLLNFVRDKTVFTVHFNGVDVQSSTSFSLIHKNSGLSIEMLLCRDTNNDVNDATLISPKANIDLKSNNDAKETISIKPKDDFGSKSNAAKMATSITPKAEEPQMERHINQQKGKLVSPKKVLIKDLTTETLPEVADLIVIDASTINTGNVNVTLNSNAGKQYDIYVKVQKYGNDIQVEYKPQADELCLVKFQDEWYRAVYCPPNFCLIDFGSIEAIERRDIREYPDELTDPCYTFFGNIQGFSRELNFIDELKKVLKEHSVQLNCICRKVDGEPYEYDITFPSVRNLLKN